MEPHLQVRPGRDEFDSLAAEWPLVPVWTELLADVSTPVGLFPALAGDGPGLILESVERSERWGRYSFVAGDPAATVVVDRGRRADRGHRATASDDGAVRRRRPSGGADRDRAFPRGPAARRISRRSTGGLMGYLAYEAAGLLDGHPAPEPDDAPCPPIGLLVIDRAVVFDHWRQRLILVAHVPAGGYDDGVRARPRPRRADRVGRDPRARAVCLAAGLPDAGEANMPDEGYRWTVSRVQGAHPGRRHLPGRSVAARDVRRARRRLPDLPPPPRDEPGAVHVLRPDAGDGARRLVAGAARARGGTARVRPVRSPARGRAGRPRSATGCWSTSCSPTRRSRRSTRCWSISRATTSAASASPASVRPTELMEVERFTKVMHIVSTVEGELREELHPLDALAVTFPAGTVTGAPKRRAMELIAEHEPTARGPYAGAVGYLTFAGDLDFCITIRTAVVVGRPRIGADGRRRRRRLRSRERAPRDEGEGRGAPACGRAGRRYARGVPHDAEGPA